MKAQYGLRGKICVTDKLAGGGGWLGWLSTRSRDATTLALRNETPGCSAAQLGRTRPSSTEISRTGNFSDARRPHLWIEDLVVRYLGRDGPPWPGVDTVSHDPHREQDIYIELGILSSF